MCNARTLKRILNFIPQAEPLYGYLEEQLKIQEAISAYIKRKSKEHVEKCLARNPDEPTHDSCGTSYFKISDLESGLGSTFWVEGLGVKKYFFYDYEDGVVEGEEEPTEVVELLTAIRKHRDNVGIFGGGNDQELYKATLPEAGPTRDEIMKIMAENIAKRREDGVT